MGIEQQDAHIFSQHRLMLLMGYSPQEQLRFPEQESKPALSCKGIGHPPETDRIRHDLSKCPDVLTQYADLLRKTGREADAAKKESRGKKLREEYTQKTAVQQAR